MNDELDPNDPRLGESRYGRNQIVPKKTPWSNSVFKLEGGTEDNDLWTQRALDADMNPIIASVFVPTDEQREAIANGRNIELVIWGDEQPPVALLVTPKAPRFDNMTAEELARYSRSRTEG